MISALVAKKKRQGCWPDADRATKLVALDVEPRSDRATKLVALDVEPRSDRAAKLAALDVEPRSDRASNLAALNVEPRSDRASNLAALDVEPRSDRASNLAALDVEPRSDRAAKLAALEVEQGWPYADRSVPRSDRAAKLAALDGWPFADRSVSRSDRAAKLAALDVEQGWPYADNSAKISAAPDADSEPRADLAALDVAQGLVQQADTKAAPVLYAQQPSVPPAGLPAETDFFSDVSLDMLVLTSWLQDSAANSAVITKVVRSWAETVKVEGRDHGLEVQLEAELQEPSSKKRRKKPRKAPLTTRRNTQFATRVSADAVIVMRHEDYTTRSNIRHSNFRNSFTARKVGPDFTNAGAAGPTPLKGPTVKYFYNGRIQAAGWKTIDAFEAFVDSLSATLGLPGIDRSAHQLSLVNGSARLKVVPAGGIQLAKLADVLRARGFVVKWDPTTGNNGLNLKVPDVQSLRSAMVFSNGYVKMFAKDEPQLARMVSTIADVLAPVFSGGVPPPATPSHGSARVDSR